MLRHNIIISILFVLAMVGVALCFTWATGPANAAATYGISVSAPTVVDQRPAKNTVACRDAQISKLQHMLVHVDHDPFNPQPYSEANDTVHDLIQHAEQLQAECK